MLRFFELEDYYHVWTITRDDLYDYRIPLKKDSLNHLITSLNSNSQDTFSNMAKKLSEVLFNPISEKLDNCRSLLLITDGGIDDITFENLVWYDEALFRNYSITYAPSASFFHYTRSKRIVSGINLLCIGCEHDSLKISNHFNTVDATSFSGPENFFDTLSKADITILKADFKLDRIPVLNAGFTVSDNRSEEFEIRLYQSFAFDFPASLIILEAIDIRDRGGRALLRSLCFGGVTGFIVINPESKPEQRRAYYTELFGYLPDNSPLEAHRLALNAISSTYSGVAKYWGDCGMTPEDEIQFARQNFRRIVLQGNKIGRPRHGW